MLCYAVGIAPYIDSSEFAMLLKTKLLSELAYTFLSIFLGGIATSSTFSEERDVEKPGTEGNGNFMIGPEYKTDPDLTDKANPKGKSFEFTMPLADSTIFRGDDSTLDPKKPVRKERKIFVYVPAAYKDGMKAPILVTLDGPSHMNLLRNALDNLTISKDPNRQIAGVHRHRRGERRQRRERERAWTRI